MKVLTVKQPWATLIAEGIKVYEFRSWKTKYRGTILIHAGTGIEKKEIEKYDYSFPKSKIIAIAEIDDCLKIDDEFNNKIISENNIVYGKKKRTGYAWKLKNIKKVKYDKEIKGKLGLWNLEIEDNELVIER